MHSHRAQNFGYDNIVKWPGTVDPQLPAVGQISQAQSQTRSVLKMHLFGVSIPWTQ